MSIANLIFLAIYTIKYHFYRTCCGLVIPDICAFSALCQNRWTKKARFTAGPCVSVKMLCDLECPFHIDTGEYRVVAIALVIVAARDEVIQQKLCLEVLAATVGQKAGNHLAAEITVGRVNRGVGCGKSCLRLSILIGPHQVVKRIHFPVFVGLEAVFDACTMQIGHFACGAFK